MKYITAKERDNFIESLADTSFPHTFKCEKHNCLVRVGNQCPECYAEESLRIQGEEIIRKGLFGKMNKDKEEQILKAVQIKSSLKEKGKASDKANNERQLKRFKTDKEYRDKQNILHREAWEREKRRKIFRYM